MAEHPADPAELVRQFCSAWSTADADELAEYFADDATWHNVALEPVVGKDAIRDALRGFFGRFHAMTLELHHQLADGNLVMNERTDVLITDEGVVEVPVCGVFEVIDGRIHRWSDYFDLSGLRRDRTWE